MAQFAIVEGAVVTNVIEASENFGHKIGAILIEEYDGVGIGCRYAEGKFYNKEGDEIKKNLSIKEKFEFLEQENEDIKQAIAELSTIIAGGNE